MIHVGDGESDDRIRAWILYGRKYCVLNDIFVGS